MNTSVEKRPGRLWASGWTFFFRWPVFRVEAADFVPASLFLGPFLQCGIYLLCAVGVSTVLPHSPPGLAAFLGFVGLSVWSGFFHDDGFADTADSLGVSKFDSSDQTLDRIHAAMKDSRLGTFGVSALIFLWLFRFLGAFSWDTGTAMLAMVVLTSRAIGFAIAWILGRFLPDSNRSAARSGHLMQAVGFVPFFWLCAGSVASLVLAYRFFPMFSAASWALAAGVTAVFGFLFLWSQIRRCGGLSGDLIGATVCFCEILLIVLGNSLFA